MGVIELVLKGFGIATRNRNLVGLLFAFGFIWNLANIPFSPRDGDTAVLAADLPYAVLTIVFILASVFMQAGSLGYILESIKTGQSNLAKFKESGRAFYLRILGINVIVGLYILILAFLAALIFLVGGEAPNRVTVMISLVIIALGVCGVLLAFLAPYIAIVDNAKVIDSLKSSFEVVRANFLKILGMVVVLVVIGFAIGFLLGAVIGFLGNMIQGKVGDVVFGFVNSLINAYLGIVVTGTFMTYYLSLKNTSPSEASA